MTFIYQLRGWLLIKPLRWAFHRMICTSYGFRIVPRKDEFWGWQMPNIHWWILYKTVFRFFLWLDLEAWRYFCDWTGGWRQTYPLIARIIHKVGKSTAGYVISGGECYHCAADEGCQVELSQDETGKAFKLIESWSEGTQDGTDHRFRGITTCPKCGYQSEYEDGSL